MPTGLPQGWTARHSRSRDRTYFYNEATKESVWDAPEGTDIEQLKLYLAQPKKVQASHLLIKHKDSRRPASWKEENITRSKEEAIEILKKHQQTIASGEKTLAEIAQTESDCSSHKRGGDLGLFGRGEMQPSFENAAFSLQVGQVSDIVESDSGVHLIQRTA